MNDWRNRAACLTEDPELFFPVSQVGRPGPDGPVDSPEVVKARRICNRCPVRGACLDEALGNAKTMGIWGGTTEDERKSMRRSAQRRELARKQAAA